MRVDLLLGSWAHLNLFLWCCNHDNVCFDVCNDDGGSELGGYDFDGEEGDDESDEDTEGDL